MGELITLQQFSDSDFRSLRLVVYLNALQPHTQIQAIGKDLTESLLLCKENRRSLKLEEILNSVLNKYPDDVVVKDIDVLFNPNYKVDVLKTMIAVRKRKRYSLLWPGAFEDGKLIYAEEGYPDYKVYKIVDYDITCVR